MSIFIYIFRQCRKHWCTTWKIYYAANGQRKQKRPGTDFFVSFLQQWLKDFSRREKNSAREVNGVKRGFKFCIKPFRRKIKSADIIWTVKMNLNLAYVKIRQRSFCILPFWVFIAKLEGVRVEIFRMNSKNFYVLHPR